MKLLFLGDSLVEWGDWDDLLPEYTVINRGMAGESLEGLSSRLGEELTRCDDPDIIIIMSGTNNLLIGDAFFPAILRSMLPRVQALCPADSKIVVCGMLPMRILAPQVLEKTNQKLKAVTRDAGCSFLDATPEFMRHCQPISNPCFLNDGVHLSSHGYVTWARALRDSVQQSG